MVSATPPLVYYDKVDGTYIKVGTGSWQHWLNKNRSFRYESFWGSFIAYKEHQGKEIVWYANRRIKDQLRSACLGGNLDLTLDKLLETAKQLSGRDPSYWKLENQTHNTGETKSTQSKPISRETELINQISDLQKQISAFQKELSELQRQLDQERWLNANYNDPVKFIWN